MENLRKKLSEDLSDYKSIPFWSWNNALDEDELCRQIEDMQRAGIGGFIMHARVGLSDEYLGEKWFSCIHACLNKARQLNMNAWVYDENGWPSGFVGGKLLEVEAYRAQYLEYKEGAFDPNAFVTYVATESGYRRVFEPENSIGHYYNIFLRTSTSNTDILNPEVVDQFIAETYEKYYARFPESFGRELIGFFTDEPQYFRWKTPYSHCIAPLFTQIGLDVKDGLIWLFVQDERGYSFRTQYYRFLNELYVHNYYEKLYNWCADHRCKLTGHTIEESFFAGQLWCCADAMPTYEYEHIPGIDWLGRNCGTELSPKQIGSVAQQLEFHQVLTETFACSGYDATPRELRRLGQYQYFQGVNLMCHHLYPYSMAGAGKRDHPPVFSPQANWFPEFKQFNDYFTRLGCLIANTREVCDVAILNPIRGCWLEYIRELDTDSIHDIQSGFDTLLLSLRKRGIRLQLIDEALLEKYGHAENDTLVVGHCCYTTLIIPDMRSLARSTYDILRQYNGKLLIMGKLTHLDGVRADIELRANASLDDLEGIGAFCEDGRTILTSRASELGDFVFLQNLSHEDESLIVFKELASRYKKLDLMTLETEPISNRIRLRKNEGIILVAQADAQPVDPEIDVQDITQSFSVVHTTCNSLVLDRAQMRRAGETYGEIRPIEGIHEDILRSRYCGDLFIKHTFFVDNPVRLILVMERTAGIRAKVNGHEISFSSTSFDINFVKTDISEYVVQGINEFEYSMPYWQHTGVYEALFNPQLRDSLGNCVYFDTTIEPAYICGDFLVDNHMHIQARKKFPPVAKDWQNHGYPFFLGAMSLEGTYYWDGLNRTTLNLVGRFMVANLSINDHCIDLVLDESADISGLLQQGDNKIKIVVKSSPRNLFGPHHYKPDPESVAVSPYHFDLRGEWIDGNDSPNYTEKYNLVDFGVDRIEIIKMY